MFGCTSVSFGWRKLPFQHKAQEILAMNLPDTHLQPDNLSTDLICDKHFVYAGAFRVLRSATSLHLRCHYRLRRTDPFHYRPYVYTYIYPCYPYSHSIFLSRQEGIVPANKYFIGAKGK